jgi:ADP-heptose:LPS heptosyltransferase
MMRERGSPTLHYLDRYLGIPALALLGCVRHKRQLPAKIERIGLLRLAGIGDTVLISAPVADLRAAFPNAELTFFSGPTNLEFAHMIEGLDRIVRVPVTNLAAGLKAIRSAPLDVLIDFGPWPRLEALLSLFARASFTIGFRTAGQHRHFGYDAVVDYSSGVHELENFRQPVRALGVRAESCPRLQVPHTEVQDSSSYAVFHPWPGGLKKELKQWPLKRWVRLAEELVASDMKVVLTGAESDRAGNDELLSRLQASTRNHVSSVAGVSLRQTRAILAGADLVVSVNTGIMHMAAAMGLPLVALHGPTSAKRWGPVSPNALVVNSSAAGCGYLNLGWEYPMKPPPCMECISYRSVRDACAAVLSNGRTRPGTAATNDLATSASKQPR